MSEPEYRFVKGEGWVASYEPIVYRVKEDEVRVGDIVVGWSYRGRVASNKNRYLISSVSNRMIIGNKPSFTHHINGTVDWFEVER